jgi:hypothetical protein
MVGVDIKTSKIRASAPRPITSTEKSNLRTRRTLPHDFPHAELFNAAGLPYKT